MTAVVVVAPAALAPVSVRASRVSGFVSALRAFAAARPGSEWDLLPADDAAVALLVGSGRAWGRVVEGVGEKLRVLRADPALGVAGVAPLGFRALKDHPANAPAPVAAAAPALALVAPVAG
jgi:hypothetical protein